MKKLIQGLLILFVILAGLAYSLNRFNVPQKTPAKQKYFSFNTSDVHSFQLNHFVSGLWFEKNKDDVWMVRRFKNVLAEKLEKEAGAKLTEIDESPIEANPKTVATVLTYLTELTVSQSITSNQSKADLRRFKFTPHGLHVIFFDQNQKELGRLEIGKSGPDPLTCFIKSPGNSSIYLVEQDFNQLLIREFSDWLIETKQNQYKAKSS